MIVSSKAKFRATCDFCEQERGISHADVKPDNLMAVRSAGGLLKLLQLIGFGFAISYHSPTSQPGFAFVVDLTHGSKEALCHEPLGPLSDWQVWPVTLVSRGAFTVELHVLSLVKRKIWSTLYQWQKASLHLDLNVSLVSSLFMLILLVLSLTWEVGKQCSF